MQTPILAQWANLHGGLFIGIGGLETHLRGSVRGAVRGVKFRNGKRDHKGTPKPGRFP